MRFTITAQAIERLGLNPAQAGREFDGYGTTEGLLGGIPRGILRWAKKQLKVERSEDIDVADARLIYYLLAIRNVNHELLPFSRIDELALADFSLTRHRVVAFDQDGDCAECNQTVTNPVHLQADDDEAFEGVRPTEAPADGGTTGTETP